MKVYVDDRVATIPEKTYGLYCEGYVTRVFEDANTAFAVIRPDLTSLQECLFRQEQLTRIGRANPSNLSIVNTGE